MNLWRRKSGDTEEASTQPVDDRIHALTVEPNPKIAPDLLRHNRWARLNNMASTASRLWATEVDLVDGVVEPIGRTAARAVMISTDASFQLTSLAVRVLPAEDREQYRNEFLTDLHELAGDQRTCRAQVAYAMRVLLRSPSLRRELRTSGPSLGECEQ